MLPSVRYILEEMHSGLLCDIRENLDPLEDLCTLVKSDRKSVV